MNDITIHDRNELITGNEFDTSILAGTKSPSTIDQYKMHFAAYCEFAGGFANATVPATLTRWRQHLYHNGYTAPDGTRKRYSVGSINLRLASIRGVMTEAAQQGYISHDIAEQFKHVKGMKQAANKDRRKANARTLITPEQMIQLVNAPDTGTLSGMMHHALLMTLAGVGMRISEATTLTTAQIYWDTNESTCQSGWAVDIAGKGKADAEPRAMSKQAYDAIQMWLKARGEAGIASDYIFTGFAGRGDRLTVQPISRVSAWRIVQRYAEAVGLEHIKPHDFRRFVGTQLARKDIRLAQKQLGHAKLETTVAHYVLDGAPIGATDDLLK